MLLFLLALFVPREDVPHGRSAPVLETPDATNFVHWWNPAHHMHPQLFRPLAPFAARHLPRTLNTLACGLMCLAKAKWWAFGGRVTHSARFGNVEIMQVAASADARCKIDPCQTTVEVGGLLYLMSSASPSSTSFRSLRFARIPSLPRSSHEEVVIFVCSTKSVAVHFLEREQDRLL